MSFSIANALLVECIAKAESEVNHSKIIIKNYEQLVAVAVTSTNYTSETFRIFVDYEYDGEFKSRRFIVKVPFLSPHYESIARMGCYEHEACMYNMILPKITELLGYAVSPDHYHTTDSRELFLEDLCESGYEVEPRNTLDLQ